MPQPSKVSPSTAPSKKPEETSEPPAETPSPEEPSEPETPKEPADVAADPPETPAPAKPAPPPEAPVAVPPPAAATPTTNLSITRQTVRADFLTEYSSTLGSAGPIFKAAVEAVEVCLFRMPVDKLGREASKLLPLGMGCINNPGVIDIPEEELGANLLRVIRNDERQKLRKAWGSCFSPDEVLHLHNCFRCFSIDAQPELGAIAIARYVFSIIYPALLSRRASSWAAEKKV